MGRILLVQPDAALRGEAEAALAAAGHSVVALATRREAEVHAVAFDVGIFDLELPDGSGLHLAARLSGFGRVQARVFTTGDPHGSTARRAASMGSVLARGAAVAALLEAVDGALAARAHSSRAPGSRVRASAPVQPWSLNPRADGTKRS